MSVAELKALVRRELRAWNEGNLTVIDALYAASFVNHFSGEDRAGLKQRIAMTRLAFPDLLLTLDDELAEGDKIVVRWTMRGTHQGTYLGVPATHKKLAQTGISFLRVAEHKIAEGWIRADDVGMLQQLGLAPQTHGPLTFTQMAEAAYRTVPTIKAADLQRRQKKEPNLLVIDVRDAAEIATTGTIPGAVNISLGTLPFKADSEVPEEWRDPHLADRTRPIVTTCNLGPTGALGGKLLHDLGFTHVQILEGGVQAWIDAGLVVVRNGGWVMFG